MEEVRRLGLKLGLPGGAIYRDLGAWRDRTDGIEMGIGIRPRMRSRCGIINIELLFVLLSLRQTWSEGSA